MSAYVVEAQLKASGVSQFTNAFEGAKKSVQGLNDIGKKVKGIGKNLTAGLTLPIVGFGAASINAVKGFDDSMANVLKISGATNDEFKKLRKEAQRLGSTTAYSASEAADGMGVLASSGMEANKIISISEDMFNLMSAGSIDAETSARVLTNTMAQFSLEAKDSTKIVDMFASGAASAEVSVEALEHAMAIAGGSLANMNMSAEDSVAVMGQLANGAIPVAQLGSTVNAMTNDIIQNSEEMEEFVEVYDSSTGKMRGLDEILNDYAEATKEMTERERDATAQKIFTGNAQRGVNAWINQGAEGYKNLTKSMKDMGNAAEVMAHIQEDTLGGSFRGLASAMEGLMIEVGDVIKGPVGEIAIFLSELAQKFGELSEGTKKTIVAIGAIVAAIGPVIMILGSLISAIGTIITFIGGVASAISTVAGVIAGAIALITPPIAIAIAIIAALVAAGVAVYKNWETIKERAVELGESIGEMVVVIKDYFVDLGSSIVELKNSVISWFTEMKDGVVNKFNELRDSVNLTVLAIVGFFTDLKDGISQRFFDVISSFVGFKNDIFNSVKDINLFEAGKNIIGGFIDGLKSMWESGKKFIGGIGGWIKDNKGPASYDKKLLVGAGNLIIGGLNKGMVDSFGDVKKNVLGMGSEIQESLSTGVSVGELNDNLSVGDLPDHMKSEVSHSLNGEKDKSPYVIYLNLGGREFRAFVKDISNIQDSEIRLEEAY